MPLFVFAAACGRPMFAKGARGPAEEAPHQQRAVAESLDRGDETDGAGSFEVDSASIPRVELAPDSYEAEQREKVAENARAQALLVPAPSAANEQVQIEAVAGARIADVAALDGDLARIETELSVMRRGGFATPTRPDARDALDAARDAAQVAATLGQADAGAAVLKATSDLAGAVDAGDSARARRGVDPILAANADVRARLRLQR